VIPAGNPPTGANGGRAAHAIRQLWVRASTSPLPAAVLFAAVAFGWLLPELGRVGVTWDEPRYFASAVRIQDWTERVVHGPERRAALSADTISAVWDADHYWNPHPPLYKEAMAATEAVLGPRIGAARGFRVASLVWFALLVGGAVWITARSWGSLAGGAAGLALLLMPRLVGHAHIAATDMPLTALWFGASTAFIIAVRERRKLALAAASLFLGWAMATKFTGYLIPVPVLGWMVLYGRGRRSWLWLFVWLLGGALAAYLFNPLAWHDPAGYVAQLVRESLRRKSSVPISTFYLHHLYGYRVPWHHPFVMTLVTVPISLLVLAWMGGARVVIQRLKEPLGILCAIEVAFFLTLLALPQSPNHDGVRLFLPMFAFVGALCGLGFTRLVAPLTTRMSRSSAVLATLAVGLLFFYPPYLQRMRIAPYFLSYYNEVIGGVRGAQAAGMEVTYWYDAVTPDFLEGLNRALPRGATVAAFPTADYFQMLQEFGMLRADIRITHIWPAPYLLMVARKGLFGPEQERIYDSEKPVLAAAVDGVNLVGLYEMGEVWSDSTQREVP